MENRVKLAELAVGTPLFMISWKCELLEYIFKGTYGTGGAEIVADLSTANGMFHTSVTKGELEKAYFLTPLEAIQYGIECKERTLTATCNDLLKLTALEQKHTKPEV